MCKFMSSCVNKIPLFFKTKIPFMRNHCNKPFFINLEIWYFLGLFKNGDPWFGPVNFHYLPGREVTSLESLFAEINPKIDLLNGVSYMFDLDGKRITSLDQIQDGGIYICSASKKFLPGNYGAYGDGFHVEPEPIPNSRNNGLISPTPIKSGLFKKQQR